MVRAPFYDEKGLKRGAWSVEEDEKLRNCVLIYGTTANWGQLPKLAGLNRCGKSCRLRWMNYLRPELKHGNFTHQEDHLILQLHQQYGNKWSVIAAALPGRTDNEIKNHWHTSLRKLRHGTENKLDPADHQTVELSSGTRSASTCSDLSADDLPHPILESSLLSPAKTTSSYAASSSSTSNYTSTHHPGGPVTSTTDPGDSWKPEMQLVYGDEDFWTQPFLMETSSSYSDLLLRFDDPVDLFYMQDQFPFM